MPSLLEKIRTQTGDTAIEQPVAGTSINFSNSNGKWFSLTTDQIVSMLEDILGNIEGFKAENAGTYVEGTIRTLVDKHIQNAVAKALAGTQTKPVYTVLGRIIHFANNDTSYPETTISLDAEKIRNAIRELQSDSRSLMETAINSKKLRIPESGRIKGGENILFYGAPGTGKSHAAKKESNEHNAYVVRTLFHPDMQNSDFLGALKPAVVDEGAVSYKFRAGPFAKALLYARKNPAARVHLVIEELNRAMAAAVFGELFQLLDRDEEGTSEYEVDAPSEEFAEWYGEPTFKLPSNLWIYATMNSADQGVYPLDTAFRRRWRQVYIPIDYTIAPTNTVRVAKAGAPDATISWPVFVEKLNAFLTGTKEINTPEDRLVGPRFLKKSELAEGILPGKLLIYLWDDLLRHHGRDMLFLDTIKTYGDLDKANRDGKQIFNPVFLERLLMNPSIAQAG